MRKNLSRKADNSSASQEISRILRNPTDHHCVRKHMPFILGQMNPDGALLPYSKPSQVKPSQTKVLTGDVDLRFGQADVPLSVSHSCV